MMMLSIRVDSKQVSYWQVIGPVLTLSYVIYPVAAQWQMIKTYCGKEKRYPYWRQARRKVAPHPKVELHILC